MRWIRHCTPTSRVRTKPSIRGVTIRYSERLAEAGIEPSVSSKGDSYDNALAEAINGLYKAVIIHPLENQGIRGAGNPGMGVLV